MSKNLLTYIQDQAFAYVKSKVVLPIIKKATQKKDENQQQRDTIEQLPVMLYKDTIQEILDHPGETEARAARYQNTDGCAQYFFPEWSQVSPET
ncbi:hypothetical protein KDA_40060 [Dictyobacter alpinus]|uniref:Uncharacterized protein n=1 Tax=Dictyobacter alpinus TaxID=2014873 RepID=A0A402BB56_9CHLR|nr:hypothetical protein KDA_40060 [Dictyobacter alpinus]